MNCAGEKVDLVDFVWHGERLQLVDLEVPVDEHQLAMRRCFRRQVGPVVFMLTDFCESTSSYLPASSGEGLAAIMAANGSDVFIGNWRGKSGGKPATSRRSNWGVHQLITEDIPALLQQIETARPGMPVLWIGEGLSSILLVSCLCRMPDSGLRSQALVHIDPLRRRVRTGVAESLRHFLWRLTMGSSRILRGVAGWRRSAVESKQLLREYLAWQTRDLWTDPEDGFNYRVAARCCALPPSLYVHSGRGNRVAQKAAILRWLEDLGRHNAQVIGVDNTPRYGHNSSNTIADPQMVAGGLNYFQVVDWIDEIVVKSTQDQQKTET